MQKHPVLHNAAWIIGCRVLQSLLQLAVGMLCARYLGPSDYGLLSYAGALVSFALPLMRLGLNETLVRELTDHPGGDGEIMGTALMLNLLSGLVCMGMVAGAASALNPEEGLTVLVCILYSLSLVTGAVEMIRYWFQYRLLAKYSALVTLMACLLVSGYRLWLLASGKSVLWFALIHGLDYGLIGAALLVLFYRQGHRLRFSLHRARQMLKQSYAYIGASMMVVLFQSTDRIMLTAMAGRYETGLYTAAVTCVTMGQFVYVALVDSARPVILKCRNHRDQFGRQMSRLYGAVLSLAAAQGLVFALGARWILGFLYGADYAGAVPVLRILSLGYLFSCMGLVRTVWILARQKQNWLWLLNLTGAVLNILLNLWWIPRAGATGAAAASLMTQLVTNFLLGWAVKPMGENQELLLRGIRPAFLLREGKALLVRETEREEEEHGQ